jgi:hypothetical protein
LNSIINIAKKIPTPQTSKDVCNTIRNYADRKFPKQEKFKESFSKLFLSLFSHRLVYAVSLIVIIVIIVTSMIFLNPGKRDQNVLLLNDVQFDAAIVMLQEEIDEYLSEFEEDAFTYLDEDILDLEKKMDDFDKEHEEYNYLF